MATWRFLTNHALALLVVAVDPSVRLRELANELGVTERSAYSIVDDLVAAGYLVKIKEGRRNRYEVQHHLPVPGAPERELAIGEVLDVLKGKPRRRQAQN
jgi:predicted DNA-binding transcriptional regulator YafY